MKRTCCNCGEPIDDGMAFCRKCGTRVAESPPETPKQMPTEETQAPSAEAKTKKTSEKKPTTTKEKVIGAIQGVIGLIVIAGLIAGLIALGSWLFQSCSSNPYVKNLENETENLFIQICEENGFDTDTFTVEYVNLVKSEKDSDLYKGTVKLCMEDGSIESAEVEVTDKSDEILLEITKLPTTFLEKEAEDLFIQICEENGFDTDTFTVEDIILIESGKGSGLYKGSVELSMEDGSIESAEVEVTNNNDGTYLEIKSLPPSLAKERFMQELFLRALLN